LCGLVTTAFWDVQCIISWSVTHINFHLYEGLQIHAFVKKILSLAFYRMIIPAVPLDINLTILIKYLVCKGSLRPI
jgi:hypothetical protein